MWGSTLALPSEVKEGTMSEALGGHPLRTDGPWTFTLIQQVRALHQSQAGFSHWFTV